MRFFRSYESYLILLAPLLNSISGISTDLYAPSLPAISEEFGVSGTLVQQTISITLIGYAFGQIVFGLIADCVGRLRALYPGMALFVAASLLAMVAPNIETLMAARILQGFAVGACQVVARALLVDNIKGERFYIAVVYLSLAWGLGPVIAPFIGGLVQHWVGWRANFLLYAVYSGALLWMAMGLRESLAVTHRKTLRDAIAGYALISRNRQFLSAVLILGASFASFLVWNIIGPHLVQHTLGHGPRYFGATALAAGLAYLVGTLLNRTLIRHLPVPRIMLAGMLITIGGTAASALGPGGLALPWLLAGILLINFGQGLLFSNVVARTMMLFPDRAGATASLFGCGGLLCAAAATALVSSLGLATNIAIAVFFAVVCVLQCIGLTGLLRAPATNH
jgi:Bcr/CflA subfamily drug resistance transporter